MLDAKGKVNKNLSVSRSEQDSKEIRHRHSKTHTGEFRYVDSTCNGCGKIKSPEAICRIKERTKDETLKYQNEEFLEK